MVQDVARNFIVVQYRMTFRRGQGENHCPELHRGYTSVHGFDAASARALPCFSPRLDLGCRFGAAGLKSIARNFTALLLRLSLRRGRAETRCPKLQHGTTSVHGFDAAFARALPGFSPRHDFGCHSGAAGRKLVDRNFNAAQLRCMDLTRRPPRHCPVFRRDKKSDDAPARTALT